MGVVQGAVAAPETVTNPSEDSEQLLELGLADVLMDLSESLAMIDEPAGLLAAADHGRVFAADQRGEDAAEQPFEVGRFEHDRTERALPRTATQRYLAFMKSSTRSQRSRASVRWTSVSWIASECKGSLAPVNRCGMSLFSRRAQLRNPR
jgi:hypothetical protein